MKIMPGINMQWPWSELLLSGQKTIETRTYPLPAKYNGIELALIETPGPRGKRDAGIEKARVIGTITFSSSFQYMSESEWKKDEKRHRVNTSDPQFSWEKRRQKVWGWRVIQTKRLPKPIPAPRKRGIVFATSCRVSL